MLYNPRGYNNIIYSFITYFVSIFNVLIAPSVVFITTCLAVPGNNAHLSDRSKTIRHLYFSFPFLPVTTVVELISRKKRRNSKYAFGGVGVGGMESWNFRAEYQ